MRAQSIGNPQLLTVTEINNPTKETCTRHYDIWYFVPVKKGAFAPDNELLSKEFHQTEWLIPDAARTRITDPSTLEAISRFEDMFNNNE